MVDLTESVNVSIAPALNLVDATEVERIVEDDFWGIIMQSSAGDYWSKINVR